jgi:hypothetical protein
MSTITRRLSPVLLLVLLLPALPAQAKCAFRKSCTKNAFRCFRVKGACQESQAGNTALCWDNGAKFIETETDVTVLGRKGKPCLTGTVQHGPAGEFQIAFVRHNKTYVFSANPDGTKSFTCPSGKVETYSGDDFRASEACGHIPIAGVAYACTPGVCQ